MKRNLPFNRTLFLIFGIILVIPVLGIKAVPESAVYDVNPSNYAINIAIGDSRLYIFQQIRIGSFDTTSMMTESNELTFELKFGGVNANLTVNAGTKVRIEVVAFNDSLIELSQIYYTLNGPVYYPDNMYVNRSSLVLQDNNGLRFIMTTNQSLINEVYGGSPVWNTEFNTDIVRFNYEDSNDSYNNWQEYEYNANNGFLRFFRMHNNHEDGFTEIEIQSTFEMNAADYTLGVATGDYQFYTLNKIQFYNWEQGGYFNDIPVLVQQGESQFYYNLKEGDRIYIEVTNTSGDYVKFKTRYLPEGESEIHDDTVHILDKTTGYFSLNQLLQGPPLLVTTNTTLISQYAPIDLEITADEIKYSSFWEDDNRKQFDSASWNLSTGWLNRYWREEIEDGILRHEFEIIAGNVTAEFAVGVSVGDSNTLQFTEILMTNADSTTSELFVLNTKVGGVDQNLTMKVGDRIDVVIKEIDGFDITVYMVFHSSADGDVTSDSWTFNIATIGDKSNDGPLFIIPTDPKIIDDMFEGKADVTYDGDKVYIDSEHIYDGTTYISQNIYDITTGWVIRMSQTTKVDGVEVQKWSAESVGTSTSSGSSDTIPSLTPVPLWPSIFFLIIAASFYRRKR